MRGLLFHGLTEVKTPETNALEFSGEVCSKDLAMVPPLAWEGERKDNKEDLGRKEDIMARKKKKKKGDSKDDKGSAC